MRVLGARFKKRGCLARVFLRERRLRRWQATAETEIVFSSTEPQSLMSFLRPVLQRESVSVYFFRCAKGSFRTAATEQLCDVNFPHSTFSAAARRSDTGVKTLAHP